MSEDVLSPLLSALRDLVAWSQKEHIRGVIIGGVAASLLGRPRLTRDIDAVVLLDSRRWEKFLTVGQQFGFEPRIQNPLVFARKNRILLVNHKPSGIDVDISLGALPFEEEAIDRAVNSEVAGVSIPLPTPEDLVIMKAVAHRPIDMIDIQAVLDVHPDLDLHRIRRWVKEFAKVLEMPEILNDLEKILGQTKK
ncbi:MAG: nucleotidyltransferase [Nitrospirae bacterium]|nr:nucleotidyltransferase [Nitrospirota bacterium]